MKEINQANNRLDEIYEEYKKSNYKLTSDKISEAVLLIDKYEDYNKVAFELSRFSTDLCKSYFEMLTKKSKLSADVLDKIVSAFVAKCTETKKMKIYALKYFSIINVSISNCFDVAIKSKQLPLLVTIVAETSNKNEESRKKFYELINSTHGLIFKLDYSEINKNRLLSIMNLIKVIYVDVFKSNYADIIKAWAEKYELITADDSDKTENTETEVITELPKKAPEQQITELENILSCQTESIKSTVKNEAVLLMNTVSSMNSKMSEIYEVIGRNWHYQEKITELEEKINIITQKLEESNSIIAEKAALEQKCAELDTKLREAYSLNSRESSLEAEKLKAEISNSMKICYKDWLEYESEEFSEENYESLQAMIKRIFRVLEKNKINFKE